MWKSVESREFLLGAADDVLVTRTDEHVCTSIVKVNIRVVN